MPNPRCASPKPSPARPDATHAAMDQLWAEWVASHLARAGLSPRLYTYQTHDERTLAEQTDAATAGGGRLVVILSSRLKLVTGRSEASR